MRRIYAVLAGILVMGMAFVACGSDGSSEVKSVMKAQVGIMEKYVTGLENAKSAQDVVAVIDEYTAGMKKIIPELKALNEKYPELAQGNMPEGMEAEMKQVEEISARIPAAMMKVASFMRDSSVQQAMTRMGQEMQKLE